MSQLHDQLERAWQDVARHLPREHYLRADGRSVELLHIESGPWDERCLIELGDGTRTFVSLSELASRPAVPVGRIGEALATSLAAFVAGLSFAFGA